MVKPHPRPDLGEWVLGIPFNRAYYSIYYQEKAMIGMIGMPMDAKTVDKVHVKTH